MENYEKAKKIAQEMNRTLESGKSIVIDGKNLTNISEIDEAFYFYAENHEREIHSFNKDIGVIHFLMMAKWAKVFDGYTYPWEKTSLTD